MEVRVQNLRDALALLEPLVSTRVPRAAPTKRKGGRKAGKAANASSVLPVLAYVRIKDGMAMASNFDAAATIELEGVEGDMLLPFKETVDMLKYVPGSQILAIEHVDSNVNLTWPEGKATLETMDPEEYPPIPSVTARIEQEVDGDTLVPALVSMVGYTVPESDQREILRGVSLFLGEPLNIGASDGNRMAYKELTNISIPARDTLKTVIIPASTVMVLDHLWAKAPRPSPKADSVVGLVTARAPISLAIGDKLQAKFGIVTLIAKTIEGKPPAMGDFIPQTPPLSVQFFAGDLERAVRGIQNMAKDSSGIVRLEWQERSLKVSAEGKNKGKAEMSIPVNASGGNGRIALNVSYILEYVKDKKGFATMFVTDESKPALFRAPGAPVVVVGAMNMQW